MLKKSAPRISALFVSYNSGEFLPRAVHSLWAQRIHGEPAQVEVIIIDNNSPKRETFRAAYEELRDRYGVTLVWHDRNDGYAAGMNLAFERSHGSILLATNPDVRYAPDCLQYLVDALDSGRNVGMTGPMGFLDDGLELVLPINQLPSLNDEMERFRGRFSKRASLEYSLRLAREMYSFYHTKDPRPLAMLSGASMMVKRETIQKHGFFDNRYPLFYEDSDICHKYSADGLDLLYVPKARVTHYVSRSVASAPANDDPMARWATARRRYFNKWYGPAGVQLLQKLDAAAKRFSKYSGKPATPCTDVGIVKDPPLLTIPGAPPETLLQIGLDSGFYLCATALTKEPAWRLSEAAWIFFNTGLPVFIRAIDTRDFTVVAAWTFRAGAPS